MALCSGGPSPPAVQCGGAHATTHGRQDGQPASGKRAAAATRDASSKRTRQCEPHPEHANPGRVESAAAAGSASSGAPPSPLNHPQQQQQQQPLLQPGLQAEDEQPVAQQAPPGLAQPTEPPQEPSSDRQHAPAWHAGCRCEPLSPAALGALRQLDPALHDLHMRLLRFDDRLAELAGRRGLLVRFLVRHSARSGGAAQQEPLVVKAPEFMTVEYLKRRVARAKLQRGEVLPTARFVLRARAPDGGAAPSSGPASSGGAASSGGGRGVLEDLPSSLPNGDEVFLASLGYEAPGPYELLIASAPQTSDVEQQEELLAGVSVQAPARRRSLSSGAAGVPPAPPCAVRRGFQALLQAPAPDGQQVQRDQQHGIASRVALGPVECAAQGAGQVVATAGPPSRLSPMPATEAASNSRAGSAARTAGAPSWGAGSGSSSGGGWAGAGAAQPRRQGGRWGPDEVAALVEGVQAFGTSWAKIHAAYARGGRISQHRTQVDLKDKWRNLARAVARGPGGQARSGAELTEEQRRAIWSILAAAGGDAAA